MLYDILKEKNIVLAEELGKIVLVFVREGLSFTDQGTAQRKTAYSAYPLPIQEAQTLAQEAIQKERTFEDDLQAGNPWRYAEERPGSTDLISDIGYTPLGVARLTPISTRTLVSHLYPPEALIAAKFFLDDNSSIGQFSTLRQIRTG